MRQTPGVRRQRGQALAFILIFAVATALAVLLLYNSSVLANTKTELQNAADAGAYAAATLQARDHNFSAYTNRAMIANQVAVAQFVSLTSYLDDAAQTQKRMKQSIFHWFYALFPTDKGRWDFAKTLPMSNALQSFASSSTSSAANGTDAMVSALKNVNNTSVNSLTSRMSQIDSAKNQLAAQNNLDQNDTSGAPISGDMQSTVSGFAPMAVKGLDTLIAALQQAQEISHDMTMADMMAVADEVVKKNDPNAEVTSLGTATARISAWGNEYTKKHEISSAAGDRFADVVLDDASQDDFSRNRSGIPFASWSSSVQPYLWFPFLCSGVPDFPDPTHTAFAFSHGGGTLLSKDKKRWLALDVTMGAGYAKCTYWVMTWLGPRRKTNTIPFLDFNIDTTPTAFLLGGSGGALVGPGSAYNDEHDRNTAYHNNAKSAENYGGVLPMNLLNPGALPTSPTTTTAVAAAIPALYRYKLDPPSTMDSAGGLLDYRDIADFTTPQNQTPELNGGAYPITVEVSRSADSVRLSSALFPNLGPDDIIKLDDAAKGKTLKAVASAHAYFYRPKEDDSNQFTRSGWHRGDGRTEMANLFSPYWQARLTETPPEDAAASLAAQ